MILRMTSATVVGPFTVDVTFNDGERGTVDLRPLLDGPIFKPLREAHAFEQAYLDDVSGTIAWPNGADLAPEAVHDLLTRVPVTRR